MFIVPLLLLFFRWTQPRLNRRVMFLLSALLSWIFVNSLMWIDPPENGFAYPVHLIFGWLWLLVPCGVLLLLEFLMFKKFKLSVNSSAVLAIGKSGSLILGLIMILFIAYGLFGRISSNGAIERANNILQKNGYVITAPDPPQWIDGYWLIYYPNSTFGEIRLDRNGEMSWIGGPG